MVDMITNLAAKENRIIDMYENIPKIIQDPRKSSSCIDKDKEDGYREELNRLLEQLNLMLEIYPDALKKRTILRKTKELLEYVKEGNLALSTCYSYFNEKKKDFPYYYRVFDELFNPPTMIYTYGIRTLRDRVYGSNITITSYGTSESGITFCKSELRLKLEENQLNYVNMTHSNWSKIDVYNKDVLNYLNPNIIGKQKVLK